MAATGWPHLMPLWYVVRDGEIWAWTYAKSQKVRNLERDPRATLQVEDGEQYQELRGVMIEARTELHADLELVTEFGMELFHRYSGAAGDELRALVGAQAPKRVALQFVPAADRQLGPRQARRGLLSLGSLSPAMLQG